MLFRSQHSIKQEEGINGVVKPRDSHQGHRDGTAAGDRPGPEIPKRQPGVGLAMGVPPAEALARQGFRRPGSSSSGSERGAEGRETSRAGSRREQGRQLPHLPPFLCNPPAGTGAGHTNHPGAARPQGCEHHHDLHPCAQPWSPRGAQPRRPCVAIRTGGSRTPEPELWMGDRVSDGMAALDFSCIRRKHYSRFTEGPGRQALVLGTIQ